MNSNIHITVATIIERDGKFLMVEEESRGQHVINQPAGHVENGESLINAAIRETLEETGWHISINNVTSLYRWQLPDSNDTYFRVAFAGQLQEHDPDQTLDDGILRALWMSLDDIQRENSRLRSPMVLRCLQDYLAGVSYPIELLVDL